ncbi:hypothetical protein SO802_005812 [Lithocarpus litseifolius]|uniref:Uncharacterized protein n=1 Tax=Lithocarpus litseifolius TaxID=425828 RepID=A0AAW2DMF1_9ROSI
MQRKQPSPVILEEATGYIAALEMSLVHLDLACRCLAIQIEARSRPPSISPSSLSSLSRGGVSGSYGKYHSALSQKILLFLRQWSWLEHGLLTEL